MAKKRRAPRKRAVKKNPTMKRGKSTGWMSARRVKIERKNGRVNVLIQKPRAKRKR